MKTVTLTIEFSVNETKHSIDFETGNDLQEAINEYLEENEIEQEYDIDTEGYEVTDWGDVSDYSNLQDIDTLNEIADSNLTHDWEIISAGIDADIDIDNIEEAYHGSYRSDEDFARETADSLGYINKDVSWPYNCIDWEQAAKELMYDYSEANGHYFRRF